MENASATKRKTFTSTAVKNRYNAKHYKQFAAKIKPELMERIDRYLSAESISKSEFLYRAIQALENASS